MNPKDLKIAAAQAALAHVEPHMRLGIGTGSTAEEFIRLLAREVAAGLDVVGVPTSERTAALCRELGVPLTTLDETPALDLTVDGADEIAPDLSLVKGGGGALLREKIVAFASATMIVIADEAKLVQQLGRFPLPIEVNAFGLSATIRAVEEACEDLGLSGVIRVREAGSSPLVTDGGHMILDASFGRIPNPRALSSALLALPGVVEHGLFIGVATTAIIAGRSGVRVLQKHEPTREHSSL